MPATIDKEPPSYLDPSLHSEKYYRELERRSILRLTLTYLAPLILLALYFHFQYREIVLESRLAHLKAIAENQSKTVDLFLRERIVNLSNLIDDPRLVLPPTPGNMKEILQKLSRDSETFVDIGFFDSDGIQAAYEGPYPQLEKRDYSREPWFIELKAKPDHFIITDIYLGFRQKPHFTIAVSRVIENRYVALRATLDPERFYTYLSSLEGSQDVHTSIVNSSGYYQLVTPAIGETLQRSSISPPVSPILGTSSIRINGTAVDYAYSWLRTGRWALIVQSAGDPAAASFANPQISIAAFSAAVILLIFSTIIIRAKKIVKETRRADKTRAQLSDNLLQASKLAAVGELASGIAHEINNPLAIINEEVGLIKDMTNPQFKMEVSPQDMTSHLDIIQGAVFRCRDITRKLLAFVRKSELNLEIHDIHEVIDEVVKSFYEREMAVSNIEIIRAYQEVQLKVLADKNQLQQVFLNLINNAIDAITGRGRITITTAAQNAQVRIEVSDTGKGMTQDQIGKIFMPFYTTKGVGKGTGLGLSISYGIIKSLSGEITVTSVQEEGTTFTITLPLAEPARQNASEA